MSHNIEYYEYPENVDKKKVASDLDNYVRHAAWQEGGHLNEIRWYDAEPCASREDAEVFIQEHDHNWYDCIAVRYREPILDKPSKTYVELMGRKKKADERYAKASAEVYASTVQSAYIGCKHCGSKVNRQYLLRQTIGVRVNACPVCRADLRPASKLENIQKASEAVEAICKKLQEESRRMSKKNGQVKWLVKIEYHT